MISKLIEFAKRCTGIVVTTHGKRYLIVFWNWLNSFSLAIFEKNLWEITIFPINYFTTGDILNPPNCV